MTSQSTPSAARPSRPGVAPQGLISRIARNRESWVLLGMWGQSASPERLHERVMLAAQTIKDLDKLPLIARKTMELAFLNPEEAERPYAAALRAGETLQGAIDRPRRLAHYEGETALVTLAASLLWGVTRSHCLIDGNKRASLTLTEEFLALNGHRFSEDEDALFELAMAAAEASIDEEGVQRGLDVLVSVGAPERPLADRMPDLIRRLATA